MRNLNWLKSIMVIAIVLTLAVVIPVQASKVMSAKDMVADCKKNIKGVALAEAKKMYDVKEYAFLDVRTEKEYKKGNIPNSVHIQRGVLEFNVEKKFPDKNAKIVVYCKSGSRSALSVCSLTRMGYTNVVSLNGGWKGWVKNGYPVN